MAERPSDNTTPPEADGRQSVKTPVLELKDIYEKQKDQMNADLKAVKEDGCSNYPNAQLLLKPPV